MVDNSQQFKIIIELRNQEPLNYNVSRKDKKIKNLEKASNSVISGLWGYS